MYFEGRGEARKNEQRKEQRPLRDVDVQNAIEENQRTGGDDAANISTCQRGQVCLLYGHGLRRRRCRLLGKHRERVCGTADGPRSTVPRATYCSTGLHVAFAWNQSCEM